MSDYPGATPPPQELPWAAHTWDGGAGHLGRAGPPVPKLASVFLHRVFSGRAASVSNPGLELQGHSQRAAGHRAGRRRSLPPGQSWGSGSTFLPFSLAYGLSRWLRPGLGEAAVPPLGPRWLALSGVAPQLRVFPETPLDVSQLHGPF